MKAFATLLLPLLLAACAAGPRPTPADLPELIERWSLAGRLSVRLDEQGWHGSLLWEQDGSDWRLRVSGPLGQGGFSLAGRPGTAQLLFPGEEPVTAAEPEDLLEMSTGFRVPLGGLRYWIQGLADPRWPARRAPGMLEQNGWTILYSNYAALGTGLRATRLRLENGRLNVRLVIDRWDPLPAPGGS